MKDQHSIFMDLKDVRAIMHRHLAGELISCVETVHTRSDNRGGLVRVKLEHVRPVVVKIWRLRNIKERIKAVVCLSNGRREWRIHRYINKIGINCPSPIAFFSLQSVGGNYEAMVVDDLGETTRGLVYLKKLLACEDEAAIMKFEAELIDITAQFINKHLYDIDHQLNNFVVDRVNQLMRVDFECARRQIHGSTSQNDYIKMISRLISSHIYAVQPEVERSVLFTDRLYSRLSVNKQLRYKIQLAVDANLSKQLLHNEVTTAITLPV